MNHTQLHPEKYNRAALVLMLLTAIVYTSHLTVLEIDPRLDEIRRGLVSLEMMLSGNYLIPSINGEPYLNKPPLYNWLLALSYHTFGINEFALRMPVIAAIFFYGWLVYYFTAKYLKQTTALLAALFFITNGRILIYDSLIGLIDILYSSLVYLGFMLVYHYGKKEKYYHLYLLSYLLVLAGYLMKGLPSLVYQGFVLLVFFGLEKKWKPLFHKAHFLSLALLGGILGGYYFYYFLQVDLSPAQFFTNLLTESTDRTFVNSSSSKFWIHLATFPLQYLYNFAPWTLYLLLLLPAGRLQALKRHDFMRFHGVLLLACSVIYWLSPNVIARYMFMLVPLSLSIAAWYFIEIVPATDRLKKILDLILTAIIGLLGIACVALPFMPAVNHLPGIWWKALGCSMLLTGTAWAALRLPAWRIWLLVLGFIILRMGFNWFVVSQRGQFSKDQRKEAEKVMAIAGNRPLYLQKGADHGNPDGLSFNIAKVQQRILPLTDSIYQGALYITDSATMHQRPHKVLYQWASEFQPNHYLVSYDIR